MATKYHDGLMLPGGHSCAAIIGRGVINDTRATPRDCSNGGGLICIGITSFDPGDGYGARDFVLLRPSGNGVTEFRYHQFLRFVGCATTAVTKGEYPKEIEFIKAGLVTNVYREPTAGISKGDALVLTTPSPGAFETHQVGTATNVGVAMADAGGTTHCRGFLFP